MSSIIKSSYIIQTDKNYNINSKKHFNNIKDKIIEDANKECERIIKEAQKKADEVIWNAQAEYEKSIEEAYTKSTKIIEDYRKKGYQEGYEIGKNEADKLLQEANDLKKEYYIQKDSLLMEIEKDVITLVMDICKKVIGKTLAEDRETILSIIKKGINSLNAKESIVIRVSQDDYDLVEMSKQRILAMANLVEDIQVKSDNTLTAGGCIIETSKGSVDTSVKTQLEEINNMLLDILNRE